MRQVRLRALLSDGTSWERLYTFKEALSTRERRGSRIKSKLDLPNGLPPAPIEECALELLGLGGEAARQPGLFVARARQLAEIAEAARQLRARYGRVPLYHAIEVEPWSRIPERRWALVKYMRRVVRHDLRPLNAPTPIGSRSMLMGRHGGGRVASSRARSPRSRIAGASTTSGGASTRSRACTTSCSWTTAAC